MVPESEKSQLEFQLASTIQLPVALMSAAEAAAALSTKAQSTASTIKRFIVILPFFAINTK